MGKIAKFEDAKAWQLAREMTKIVYQLTAQERFRRDYALREQMRRAVVSITSNIAEGFERTGDKEFCHFLNIAKGSVGEVRSQAYLALDLSYINQESFLSLKSDCETIAKLLWGLMNYLKKSN